MYIQTHNHFISFVVLGGGSGFLLLQYINNEAAIYAKANHNIKFDIDLSIEEQTNNQEPQI